MPSSKFCPCVFRRHTCLLATTTPSIHWVYFTLLLKGPFLSLKKAKSPKTRNMRPAAAAAAATIYCQNTLLLLLHCFIQSFKVSNIFWRTEGKLCDGSIHYAIFWRNRIKLIQRNLLINRLGKDDSNWELPTYLYSQIAFVNHFKQINKMIIICW